MSGGEDDSLALDASYEVEGEDEGVTDAPEARAATRRDVGRGARGRVKGDALEESYHLSDSGVLNVQGFEIKVSERL